MSLQLPLYWVSLAMLAGLGARHLTRKSAWMLGLAAIAFWVFSAVVFGGMDSQSQSIAVAIAAGGLAMTVFVTPRAGVTVSDTSLQQASDEDAIEPDNPAAKQQHPSRESEEEIGAVGSIASVPRDFDRWLSTHRDLADPWPDFGEFVRSTLLACCGASQIKAYRLLSASESTLLPLHETAPKDHDFPPLRSGIRGYVATSGKNFYEDDEANDSIHELAELGDESCAWCFAVQVNGHPIGVIQVGELSNAGLSGRQRLVLMEGMISLCWIALTEACRSRVADETDSVAGVLTSEAFLNAASRALSTAHTNSEPAAIVCFEVEGLRRLTDSGNWEIAKDAIRRVSEIIRERIREDDLAGFFDGSRFVVMLARVDAELASLIVKKIQGYINEMLVALGEPANVLFVRCGLIGSSECQPAVHEFVSAAIMATNEARKQGQNLLIHSEETCGVNLS